MTQSEADSMKHYTEESSSLVSSLQVSQAGETLCASRNHSLHIDIRGMALLPKVEFWRLFILLGALAGVGLMTIKSVNYAHLSLCLALLTDC